MGFLPIVTTLWEILALLHSVVVVLLATGTAETRRASQFAATSRDSCFAYRSLCLGFRFVFAAGWPAAPFHFSHPGWRTPAPLTAATRQPFQTHDGFFNLFSLLAEFRQHFRDVHSLPNLINVRSPLWRATSNLN